MKSIVVIPIYKSSPDEWESMSLRQCAKVLGRHGLCFVCPYGLELGPYTELTGNAVSVERFEKHYFKGIEGYNRLLKDRSFYLRFQEYDYMLIYQLDAWVFEDRLTEWCSRGFDYIGAPWFENWQSHEEGSDFLCVGNGGFSLRRVERFLQITDPEERLYTLRQAIRAYLKGGSLKERFFYNKAGRLRKQLEDRWEDVFFCYDLRGTRLELKTPDCKEAALFSIETSPQYVFNEVNGGKLPFGCHAWRRYQYEEFWKDYIKDNDRL